jgi:hypothetical protein
MDERPMDVTFYVTRKCGVESGFEVSGEKGVDFAQGGGY